MLFYTICAYFYILTDGENLLLVFHGLYKFVFEIAILWLLNCWYTCRYTGIQFLFHLLI